MAAALITGGAGQLGSDLSKALAERGVAALDHAALDIADADMVERAFEEHEPTIVLNCAAFHNVDAMESEESRSFETNAVAVKGLAERCAERGAKLVHFSTNYVFDGESDRPYSEDDPPSPRSVYGLSKLAGEYAALAYAPDSLVIRTAGLYGLAGSASKGGNFVQRMLGRAKDGDQIKMVSDQLIAPTFTADLAAWVEAAVAAGGAGVLNLTNAGICSWHEFTLAIMERAGLDATVEAVETTPHPGTASRPLNGILTLDRARSLGIELRDWSLALTDYMEQAGLS